MMRTDGEGLAFSARSAGPAGLRYNRAVAGCGPAWLDEPSSSLACVVRGGGGPCRFFLFFPEGRLNVARQDYLFTSESVSEGHPDKVCDRISDTVVDAFIAEMPEARVACETFATTNRVVIGGEIGLSDQAKLSEYMQAIPDIARACIRDIGYEQDKFHWETVEITNLLHEQSAHIAQGVTGERGDEGAGDQRAQQRSLGIRPPLHGLARLGEDLRAVALRRDNPVPDDAVETLVTLQRRLRRGAPPALTPSSHGRAVRREVPDVTASG